MGFTLAVPRTETKAEFRSFSRGQRDALRGRPIADPDDPFYVRGYHVGLYGKTFKEGNND